MKRCSALFLLCSLFSSVVSAEVLPATSDSSGKVILATTLDDLDGRPVALADFKGKPLVLNFWASWCEPCRREAGDLAAIRRRYASHGLQVIGVAVEAAYSPELKPAAAALDYLVLTGREKGIWLLQTLGNKAADLPYTVLIDAQGNIVYKKHGQLQRPSLEAAIDASLK